MNATPRLVANLRAVPLIADELMRCENLDTLFRRTIELIRAHLGVERCALFLVEGVNLCGTYGTTIDGNIIDESAQRFLFESWKYHFQLLKPEDSRWIVVEETRKTWTGESTAPVGDGWIAVTPIYSGNELIGVFVNDSAISNSPIDLDTQEVIAVFGSLLGSIIERKRAEDALRKANEELESRVHERTIELERSNAALQDEVWERFAAQEALAAERAFLRTLIDNIPDYIFIKDTERRFLISNIAHAQSVGLSDPNELIGKTAYDFFPHNLALRFDADDRDVIQSGNPLIGVERITLDAQGNRIWASTTKVPLRDAQGNIIGLVGISRNITDRKRAQETLANERSLLRTVIDAIPHLMWMKDTEGRFVLVNNYTLEDREINTPASMIGKTDFDIHPKEMAEKYHADDMKVIQTGIPLVDIEEMNYTHKGEPRWLLTTKVPIRDVQGNITGLVGFARDITEQKLAREALANERTLLRTIIDALPHLIWVKDTEGRFVLINKFSQMDRENTAVGKTDFDIHPLEDALRYYEDDQQILRFGKSFIDVEEQNVSPRGDIRWLLTTKVPLLDGQGKITGLVGIARDITDRKLMEDALRTSEERYRSLVELAPDGIVVITDKSFKFVNRAAGELFGCQNAEDLLDKNITDYFQGRDRDVLEAAIMQVHRTGEPTTCLDMQLIRTYGESIHCEMVLAPVDFNGHPTVQIIIRDVTERVQAELLRRESEGLRVALEKEQEIGDLKTKLMTTLSHELRTPLTIIQSSSEFLDRFFERLSTEQRKERLQNIQGQVQKLTTLAEDVSFLIRERIDQISARFVATDLEQLCREIIDEMEFFGDSPRNLHLQIDGDFSSVLVDPRLIRRALSNLVSNAIKYSAESAEVTLRLKQEGNVIILQVSDNGIGIPEQDRERLFEIFHRGSNVGYISGTGIGLAIVKEAVSLHHGTISVESAEGVGTTFTIKLPVL